MKKARKYGLFEVSIHLVSPIWWEKVEFEPPKLEATDLQSAPFGHSGILPYE